MIYNIALSTVHYYPDSDLFNPAQTSTPRGAYIPCFLNQCNGLISHKAISSCQVLSYGWVNQSPNDDIAVAGLEPGTFGLRAQRSIHCAIMLYMYMQVYQIIESQYLLCVVRIHKHTQVGVSNVDYSCRPWDRKSFELDPDIGSRIIPRHLAPYNTWTENIYLWVRFTLFCRCDKRYVWYITV